MSKRAVVRPIHLPPGKRVLAVSDIHGNLPLLKGVLKKANFSKDDILIILGDILERSEGSLDTLQFVINLCNNYTVYPISGNCDEITHNFVDESIPEDFFDLFLPRWREKSTVVQMARLAGVEIRDSRDYPAARRAIAGAFPRELDFLRNLPTILCDDHYIFVHGGVPREDRLEELSAFRCMKNDAFLDQGHSFRKWLIVGHWPVTLYRADIAAADPIVLYDRHIASIDGGCTLKWDGQLNALILPPEPGGQFTWVSDDGLPTAAALDGQEASKDPLNVRFGHSELELLAEGPEFCRCRHVETGRELDVLTEYLHRGTPLQCEDSTDYRLPVSPGDIITIVRKTSRGYLAKKDGVTGWYFGRVSVDT